MTQWMATNLRRACKRSVRSATNTTLASARWPTANMPSFSTPKTQLVQTHLPCGTARCDAGRSHLVSRSNSRISSFHSDQTLLGALDHAGRARDSWGCLAVIRLYDFHLFQHWDIATNWRNFSMGHTLRRPSLDRATVLFSGRGCPSTHKGRSAKTQALNAPLRAAAV